MRLTVTATSRSCPLHLSRTSCGVTEHPLASSTPPRHDMNNGVGSVAGVKKGV